jgi:hypothetical protein
VTTTYRELEPKRTPINYDDICNALLLCWDVTDVNPTRKACRLAAAQIAIESGLSSCWNYNVSGIKAKPNNGKTHWQYFTTTERFTEEQLAYAQRLAPGIEVVGPSEGLTLVKVHPKHPYCCFRAFETFPEAMKDHLLTLQVKFPDGFRGLMTGDPAAFAHGLKANRYYTAVEHVYKEGLEWRLRQVLRDVPDSDLVWGDVL